MLIGDSDCLISGTEVKEIGTEVSNKHLDKVPYLLKNLFQQTYNFILDIFYPKMFKL